MQNSEEKEDMPEKRLPDNPIANMNELLEKEKEKMEEYYAKMKSGYAAGSQEDEEKSDVSDLFEKFRNQKKDDLNKNIFASLFVSYGSLRSLIIIGITAYLLYLFKTWLGSGIIDIWL